MSNWTIEEEITQGRVLWIDNILYDSEARTVVVKFVSDPESGIIDRKLIFANVKRYAESIHGERDADTLDDFIGLEEDPCGGFVLFWLVTGDKEVSFSADPAPAIEWARASSSESDVERSERNFYSGRVGPDGKTTWAHDTGERIEPLKPDEVRRFRLRSKREKLGLCVKCGYDLRASKERCPECGQEFETGNLT